MQHEGSLPRSKETATCPCPEQIHPVLAPLSHFSNNHFNIILSSKPRSSLRVYKRRQIYRLSRFQPITEICQRFKTVCLGGDEEKVMNRLLFRNACFSFVSPSLISNLSRSVTLLFVSGWEEEKCIRRFNVETHVNCYRDWGNGELR